jgi:hypothetical protein
MGKKRRRNRQHQVRLYNGWLDDYQPILTGNEVKVYNTIASYCDWQTGRGCPTFTTISKGSGVNYDSIHDAIVKLKEAGVLDYEFRKAKNQEGAEYGRKRYFYKLAHKASRTYFRNDNFNRK